VLTLSLCSFARSLPPVSDVSSVTEASNIGPALDRARNYDGPYLVNVLTDPEVAYPRSTTGI